MTLNSDLMVVTGMRTVRWVHEVWVLRLWVSCTSRILYTHSSAKSTTWGSSNVITGFSSTLNNVTTLPYNVSSPSLLATNISGLTTRNGSSTSVNTVAIRLSTKKVIYQLSLAIPRPYREFQMIHWISVHCTHHSNEWIDRSCTSTWKMTGGCNQHCSK